MYPIKVDGSTVEPDETAPLAPLSQSCLSGNFVSLLIFFIAKV